MRSLILKRKGNLYPNLYKMENIIQSYNEVCRNTKNKKKVSNFKDYRSLYIARIYNVLINKSYTPRSL